MNRVVVTGIGIVCSVADNYQQLDSAIRLCRHGIGPVTLFETSSSFPVAEVKNLAGGDSSSFRTELLTKQAVAEALDDSRCLDRHAKNRVGISFSTSTIGMLELEETFLQKKQDLRYSQALSVGEFTRKIAVDYGITGPTNSFSTACSSSSNALAYGFFLVKEGICDAIITGGADSLCRMTYYGFQSLKVMSPFACTPFDESRQGMNIGEGAAVLILESLDSARRSKAKIYGEFLGAGINSDSHHMSAPDPQGVGAYLAMHRAIEQAGVSPAQIDYINTHGTATQQNDVAESIAIHKLLGERSSEVYIGATKSYVAHTLGAAGAISAVFSIHAMEQGFIPPILGLSTLDPECAVHPPPPEGIAFQPRTVLLNAFAFGGHNTSLLLRKFDD